MSFIKTITISLCALSIFVLLQPQKSYAHKIKVFAALENGNIKGYGYYTSGVRVKNAKLQLTGANGELFQETKTDNNGEFNITPQNQAETIITLTTADGHKAEWVISGEEFSPKLSEQKAHTPHIHTSSDVETTANTDLKTIQKQINQLRAQIDAQHEEKRLQDILGGIGYILGIMGLLFYFKSRKK